MSKTCPICKKSLDRCKCTPEDLGLKVGSKEEVAWRDIKEKVLSEMAQFKRGLILNERIIEVCDEQMKIEAEKFRNKDNDL